MGTYFVEADRTEILAFIHKFAHEEGLGKVGVREQHGSSVKVHAPISIDLRRPRYTWICKSKARGCSIKLRLRPPILKFLGIYLSFAVLSTGLYTLGILFIVRGPHAVEHDALSFGVTTAVLGLLLLWGLRYFHTERRLLALESLFASRLRDCFPRVKQSPRSETLHLVSAVLLIYTPFASLFVGLIRAMPVVAVLTVPCFALAMALILANITAVRSTWSAWRVILLGWIVRWSVARFMTFIALLLFAFFGGGMLFLSRHEWFEPWGPYELLTEAFGPHSWEAPRGIISQSILENNATILQQAMEKYQADGIQLIVEADLLWRIMVCAAVILVLGAAKGLGDWIKTWLIVDPVPGPTLSPPPTLCETSSSHAFYKSLTALALLFAAVANIFHLLLTIEILSVIFLDRATLSHSVAQAVGWLEINLVAAAEGNVCRDVIGTTLLIMFTLPTAITVLAWVSYFMRQAMGWFKSALAAPVDDEYLELLHELSSEIGIRSPHLYVTQRKEPYMVTTMPWFLGRSQISVSWSTLKNLTKFELRAAFAHELSHIKYDTAAIHWTRLLSLLSVFSCNAFALLLDMESRERRADNAATKTVGSNEALARALVKASLAQSCTLDAKTAGLNSEGMKGPLKKYGALWARIVDRASLLGLLFRPETIIGYTHPRIQDRLTALCRQRTRSTNDRS